MTEMPLFLLSVNSQSQERTSAETLVSPHHSLLSAEQSQGRGVPPAYCPRVLGIISIQRTSARVRPHPTSRVEGAGRGCSMLHTYCGGGCHCDLLAGTRRKCSWHVSWVGVGMTPDCLVCGKCWGWRSPIGHLKLRDVQLVAISQETGSTTQTRGGAGMSSCVHKSLFLGF